MKKRYQTMIIEADMKLSQQVMGEWEKQGWKVVASEPIEEMTVQIVGRRLTFEKPIEDVEG